VTDTPLTVLIEAAIVAIKERERELSAYRSAYAVLRIMYQESVDILDATLAQALQSPALAELMRQKYDIPLETWLQQENESLTVEQALELFRKIKKTYLV